jgi:hypothetical protein
MEVVGHDNEFVAAYVFVVVGNVSPARIGKSAYFGKIHD